MSWLALSVAVPGAVSVYLALTLRKTNRACRAQEARVRALTARNASLTDWADTVVREKAAAEEASRMKSRFLAGISHELRTPLGAILGFVDLLRHEELGEAERSEYLETIARNGVELSRLIDDLLDLSKAEEGRLETQPEVAEVAEVAEVVEGVLELLTIKAREKGLDLFVRYGPDLPQAILTDRLRLRQILINVVGNAIKFTQEGSVAVDVSRTHVHGLDALAFAVTDTGKGIDSGSHHRLFEPFSQSDTFTARKYGGTGLGLALSRRIARLLGGDVTLEWSVPGRGSRFRIEVACHMSKAQELGIGESDDGTGARPASPPWSRTG